MNTEWQMPAPAPANESEPRIQAALAKLQEMIRRHVPGTTFTVTHGEDPEGIDLTPVDDVEDLDEVSDVYMDCLIDMQVEEGLPVYVVPEWPMERIRAHLRHQATTPIAARSPVLRP